MDTEVYVYPLQVNRGFVMSRLRYAFKIKSHNLGLNLPFKPYEFLFLHSNRFHYDKEGSRPYGASHL